MCLPPCLTRALAGMSCPIPGTAASAAAATASGLRSAAACRAASSALRCSWMGASTGIAEGAELEEEAEVAEGVLEGSKAYGARPASPVSPGSNTEGAPPLSPGWPGSGGRSTFLISWGRGGLILDHSLKETVALQRRHCSRICELLYIITGRGEGGGREGGSGAGQVRQRCSAAAVRYALRRQPEHRSGLQGVSSNRNRITPAHLRCGQATT